MRRTILPVVAIVLTLACLGAPTAFGDAVYHSEHVALMPVGGQPLRTGFVENIHANGPVVYAMERYVLNGASPGTTYDVALNIWVEDTSCAGEPPLVLSSVSFTTNGAGNGVGMVRFSPEQADGLRDHTLGIIWTLSIGTTVAYHTACTDVTLD